MSLKKIVVILIIFANSVSGLEMCHKPMIPPEIKGISISPEVPDNQRIKEFRVSLRIKSRAQFRIEWLNYRNMLAIASADNEDFRSSTHISKGIMTFHLYTRNNRSEAFGEQISGIQLLIFLGKNDGCNYVSWSVTLKSLRTMLLRNIALPTIFVLPNRKYVVDQDRNYTLTFTLSRDNWTNSFRDKMMCRYSTTRTNGEINVATYKHNRNKPVVQKVTERANGESRTSYTCLIDMVAIESLHAGITYTFETNQLSEDHHFSVEVGMGVELRRSGINKPAVTAYGNQFIEHRVGVIYIATDEEDALLHCIAEGPVPPGIAAARIGHLTIGDFDILEPLRDHLTERFQSKPAFYTFKNFLIRSPDVGQAEEYVCSAAVDGEVVSKRVNLLRYVGVKLKQRDWMYAGEGYDLYPRTRLNDTITASCETTQGDPRPSIQFYGSPPQPYEWRKNKFMKANEGYEIVDSRLFRVEVNHVNDQAKGKITVRNMNNATFADLKGFDYASESYSIYCVAFNKYSIDITGVITWSIRKMDTMNL